MLLNIQNFSVIVKTPFGDKILVDNITLGIEPRTIAALVGGSGSGKTTTGLGILRLLAPGLRIVNGCGSPGGHTRSRFHRDRAQAGRRGHAKA